ncbi:MAG: glycosyltransferase [Ignavibacteria bacterium]|nr:glycosyltransferase [Ignavibacteria bacterium]
MKKRIILVGPAYPYRGGNALFVAHLYEALSKAFEIEVVNFSRLYPQLLFPGSRQEDVSKVPIKKHPSTRLIDSINPISWIKTINYIKAKKPDLIAFIWYQPFFGFSIGTIARALHKKFKNKILFITENIVSHESMFYDKILTKYALASADKFLVLSDVVEKGIRSMYPDKKVFRSTLPIYDCYGFDSKLSKSDARKKLGIGDEKKVLLFFGYIRAYKGLMNLIEAMPILLEKDENYFLLIVGEFYESKEKYFDRIKELEISKNVLVIDEFVPNEEVGIYYSAADVVVLPYNSATQSGILNIAYGFKKPVVVTNVGGLPELVEDGKTGFIVEPRNPKALAEGIEKCINASNFEDFQSNIETFIKKNSFMSIEWVFNEIINSD